MTPSKTAPTAAPATPLARYSPAIGYLRAFIVVLVVAHHAVLAYCPFAPLPPASLSAVPRSWEAFLIADARRWGGFVPLVGFDDIFFMSLMFFLSGLFVWHGLQRKGGARFLRDRLLRLGLPFAVMAAVVAPLAYYATYLQTPAHAGLAGFWRQWLSLGHWPAGPGWFVWVLLGFDGLAALLFAAAPRWGETLGRMTSGASRKPVAFFAALAGISATVYIPMALLFTPGSWTGFGPFAFQTSRILHYLAYFLVGACAGAWGVDRGLLARDGALARRWPLWSIAALVLFGVAEAPVVRGGASLMWAVDLGFVLSCAASSFASLALFIRWASGRSRWWDSLSANSYAIFLLHYPCVSWLQYALLPAPLPAIVKGAVVFFGALAVSWGAAAGIRRIPAVARVV
ncbi:MAG TPA: acyltransferase [Bryobacteraceae bacterium]|nr:acyltransferase [Bryobacteraceae bacterium]